MIVIALDSQWQGIYKFGFLDASRLFLPGGGRSGRAKPTSSRRLGPSASPRPPASRAIAPAPHDCSNATPPPNTPPASTGALFSMLLH